MRQTLILISAMLIVASVGVIAQAQPQVADLSSGNPLGFGLEITSPFTAPDTFPASGLSSRLWIANLFGLEAAIFVVNGAPSLATRTFIKYLNTSFVDLYVGTGAAFFGNAGEFVVPLHAVTGLELRFSENLALNGEVGMIFRGVSTISAGLGIHFYL